MFGCWGGVWLLGGKKSSTALIKKISLSTVLTAFDDLKNGFLSFAVLEGRLRGAGLCGLSSKSMFKLDVSLQLHAMRPVLQTVTIGHATFVRDIYEARRCAKPINEWINNKIAFKKKKKKTF